MAKVSKDTTERLMQAPVAVDRSSDLEGYTVSFVTITEGHDLAPMLAGLPGGNCSCPHWGYVFKGRMTVTYPDHDEVIEAGEAFYLPPGHTPAAETGSEFLMFSPAAELAATNDAVMAAMQAMQQA